MLRSNTSGSELGSLSAPASWPTFLTFAAALIVHPGPVLAGESPELIQPPICSAATVGKDPRLEGICEVTPRDDDLPGDKVKLNLTVNTGPIEIGGYRVVTEHYNDSYSPPTVRARAGDVVAAELVNLLPPREQACVQLKDPKRPCENPTNLHYFHGGIVSPQNRRKDDIDAGAGKGKDNVTGDNIYVRLANGIDEKGRARRFNFNVPIPGEKDGLDARVLEGKVIPGTIATIPHPPGLNWYHSHLHRISSDQMMGGMSGLLSVGEDDANVKAACRKNPSAPDKCLNADTIAQETAELKWKTEVRYVLLRDIMLRDIAEVPEAADGAHAVWAPELRDFPPLTDDKGNPITDDNGNPIPQDCKVWRKGASEGVNDEKLRKGYCQPEQDTAWLFTLNGQRFPTITVEGNRNLLLRLGNIGSNVTYWLELYCETCEKKEEEKEKVLPLKILALDGVVPVARPVSADEAAKPVDAIEVPNLLLLPAARAEIYVRNDVERHEDEQVYILRTKGLDAGTDYWPEIQLARIVLKPNQVESPIVAGLNAPIEKRKSFALGGAFLLPEKEPKPPSGCVRDIDPAMGEHRRVTFDSEMNPKLNTDWAVKTEIVQPPPDKKLPVEEKWFKPDPDPKNPATVGPVPFEAYRNKDDTFDWTGERNPHVCVELKPGGSSHKQLWVLRNNTTSLHNFHIHQMKFRLAKASELCEHGIQPPAESQTCPTKECDEPDQKFYEDDLRLAGDLGLPECPETLPAIADTKNAKISAREWHDTIPMPVGGRRRVFLIMSFDDDVQLGRFVFHCHILKHEDRGLMAPIEVWNAEDVSAQ